VLSALLTDGALSERLLGGNVWYSGVARMFVCASSNNASLDRDLSRRFVRVRIDPGVERPNSLGFPFDPIEVALSERLNVARAVLVVIRGYHGAGAPRSGTGDAGFGQWNRLVSISTPLARGRCTRRNIAALPTTCATATDR